MCVIALAGKGVQIPNEEIMKSMYQGNSDGAGFAYMVNHAVHIEKGFMEYKEFDNAVAGLEKRLKRDHGLDLTQVPIMFHFRIGTHGANSRDLTHPFPVTTNRKLLAALDLVTDVAMAHNGIINDITVKNTHSDTTQYVANVLSPLKASNKYFFKNKHIQKLIENTINGSRFVFLDRSGEFTTIGHWKESTEAPGVLFSNLNHEFSYSYPSQYGNYGWHGVDNYTDYDTYGYLITDEYHLTNLTNISSDGRIVDMSKVYCKENKDKYGLEYFYEVMTGDIIARSLYGDGKDDNSTWYTSTYDAAVKVDDEDGTVEFLMDDDFKTKPTKLTVRDYWTY